MWTIVSESFYFISFALEYYAFLAIKNTGRMTKVRNFIDLLQLGIVIWGFMAVDFRNLEFSKDAEEELGDIEKR